MLEPKKKSKQSGDNPEQLEVTFPTAHLSVMVLLLALLNQIFYYKCFNVPIKNYLSLSNIGLAVSDQLIIVIPLLLAHILFFFFTYKGSPDFPIKEPKREELSKFRYRGIAYYSLFLFLFFCAYGYFKQPGSYTLKIHVGAYVVLLLYLLLIYIFRDYVTDKKYFGFLLTLSSFLTALVILLFIETIDLKKVIKGKYNGTVITFSDSTSHISSDTSYYIGEVENYVFVYNTKDSTATILPRSGIKQIKLKSK